MSKEKQIKYVSLFSGIGGFEVAIHKKWPDAKCLFYSEVKPSALKVYESHFPSHLNLGDITNITEKKIKEIVKDGCDLLVGGFPCTNLSSMANINGNSEGLEGPKSGLFWEMIRIIKIVNKITGKKVNVIFENNFSMTNKNKKLITNIIKEEYPNIYMTPLNGAEFGVQRRKRIFWTNFSIEKSNIKCTQTWSDVLDKVDTNPNISDNYLNLMNKCITVKRKENLKDILQVLKKENDQYYFEKKTINNKYKSRW